MAIDRLQSNALAQCRVEGRPNFAPAARTETPQQLVAPDVARLDRLATQAPGEMATEHEHHPADDDHEQEDVEVDLRCRIVELSPHRRIEACGDQDGDRVREG